MPWGLCSWTTQRVLSVMRSMLHPYGSCASFRRTCMSSWGLVFSWCVRLLLSGCGW